MNHSTSRRSAKALPQIEATIPLNATDNVLCQVAQESTRIGKIAIAANTTYYLAKSYRRQGRYYAISWSNERKAWECSCAISGDHDHTKMVRDFIAENETREQVVPSSSQTVVLFKIITAPAATPPTEPTGSEKLTVEQWKEIAKRDKARQKDYYEKYRRKARKLREAAEVA